MIKPKTKSGKFNVHEDDNDFNDEEWRRPSGRNSKVSNKDEGLNVENRSDISDSEDIGVHQMRKRIQNRKKVVNKGNINIHDKLSSFNDDLEYQRPKK